MCSGCVSRLCLLAAALLHATSVAAADHVRPAKAQGSPPIKPDRCANSEPAPNTPIVPGGDMFGILSPTDVGDPCSFSYAAEFTGRARKRDGNYIAVTTKSQFTYTYSEQLAFSVSPFVSGFSWNDVDTNRDILRTSGGGVDRAGLASIDFDGVSAEATWRVLARSINQPLAIALSAEPRYFRRDAITGFRVEGGQIELKLFADIALSERWFAAVNVIYGLGMQRFAIEGAELQNASAYGLLSALTWQAYRSESGDVQGVFIGGEARYIAGFSGLTLNFRVGEALFAGPTMAIAFKGGSMLNLIWSPQLGGEARPASAPGALDLDGFERHQFRIKFAMPLPF